MAALSGNSAPIGVAALEPAHHIRERARNQKVLLHKAQPLPAEVESSGYRTRVSVSALRALRQRLYEIAAAELLKIEIFGRIRGPQAQCIDSGTAIADDRTIIRDPDQS